MRSPGRVIWLCGATAVGKSTASWAVYSALLQEGVAAGYLDLRQLGFLDTSAAGLDHALQATNVASLWGCFSAAGATHLVLSGSVETSAEVNLYGQAIPAADLTLYRLRASKDELARRLQARGRGQGPRLVGDWLINRPAEVLDQAANRAWTEQEGADVACIADVLETTGATPTEIAGEVLRRQSEVAQRHESAGGAHDAVT